ncbi:MAG: OmpH family outer membrane protein [Terriglobales bacterium]|jgi:outer membrane protein
MTRKLAIIAFAVTALALGAFAQAAASAPAASGPAPAKIGIINIQAAIVNTNEGQRDFQALEKKMEPKKAELQRTNAEVEDLKKQLSTQGDKLNEAAHAELVKNIETKSKALQRSYEDAQADFTTQQNEIANRIGQKMVEILEKYSTANGYAVVLDVSQQQSPVLWASASTNITKPIVDAYNAQSNVPPQPTTTGAPTKPTAPSATTTSKPATTTTPAAGTTSTPPKK